jgi:UDP-4-amino-4,6-dideoxy-L-N-acetyl-beta-L-altrosamine transaminase
VINYGKQFLDQKDVKAVINVLKSDWLTQGPQTKLFENSLKKYFGSKYCTAVSNGTAALHLATKALNFKKGDHVFTTPNSFLATSNSILYCGASPVFVDIEKDTYNIDVEKLEKKIKLYKKNKKKIKAIIATDYAGQPCDWKRLYLIKKKYNLSLINDNCHAMGASYYNNKKYAIKYADLVTHSYHPVKNITCGEGGAVLTNNKLFDDKIKLLRSHGYKKKKSNPWHYEMLDLGYNYRLSDINCALGNSQLSKLDIFIKKRRSIANMYNEKFKNEKYISIPKCKKNIKHAYHIYPLRIDFKKFKIRKIDFLKKMKRKKISLQVHYIPIFKQPYYKKNYKIKEKEFKNSIDFYNEEVSLPLHVSLKYTQIRYIINQVKNILKINKNAN